MSKAKKTFRIALDAMGTDSAPKNEIEGVIRVFEHLPTNTELEIVFVGNENLIKDTLKNYDLSKVNYSILHADQVVTMDDEPTAALKTKKNSSIYQGLLLHKEGKVDAFLSAGNTGAMMSTATILLGRIKGVSRPTIGTFFPTETKRPTLILDVGANVDSKPRFLYEFAVMGSLYSKLMLGIDNPRVSLVNIGEEATKGNEIVQQTYQLLKNSNLNFIGNVEGRDIFIGKSDVLVCDGFTGNIILKFAESFLGFFKSTLKQFADESLSNKLKVGLMAPTLRKVFKSFDYQEYGGVPLLGVNGVVIIGHGSSTAKAIHHMILRSMEIIDKELNLNIEIALKDLQ